MHKWPIALGSLTAAVVAVVATLAVAGVFDSDSAASPGDGEQPESAALCVEGVEDCEDTVVVPVGDEDDDSADAPPPRDDDPGLPVSGDGGETDEGRALAVEAAFAALEAMDGPPANEVDVTEVRAVTWNDACLGIETPGIACAQVITSGYVVVLDTGTLAYEFHTNTSGHAVLADTAAQ